MNENAPSAGREIPPPTVPSVGLLGTLSPAHRERLAQAGRVERFVSQDLLISAGESAHEMVIVLSGNVLLETPYLPGRGIVVLEELGPGDVLGCSSFFHEREWQFTARAASSGWALRMETSGLRDTMERDRDFGYAMALKMAEVLYHRLQVAKDLLERAWEFPSRPPD